MTRLNAYIGSPIERIEDPRLLTGRGIFVGDLHADGLLHAAILRSPVAHGLIRRIDAAAALELDGVVAVISAADIAAQVGSVPLIPIRQHGIPQGEPYRQPVIAAGKVRYVGEPIAIVIATDPAIAEDALGAIVIEIDELPPVADHVVSASDATLLFDDTGTNLATVFSARIGENVDEAFARADYTRRERFSVQRHTALPMETRGLFAAWDDDRGRLTVHGATKVPFFNRRVLANMLGLAETAVDLIEVEVGGGFGARGEFYPEDFLVPFAARWLRTPVRWVEDRREHLMAMNHAREMVCGDGNRLPAGRHGGRHPRPDRHRSWRLCPDQRLHHAAQRGPVRVGTLRDPASGDRRLRSDDEQDADRQLSRARPL